MNMKKDETKYDDCPCGRNCCEKPEVVNSEHECSGEDVCEACYQAECLNCGKSCHCDL